MARLVAVILLVIGLPAAVLADEISPEERATCTLEHQSRDGSRCEVCSGGVGVARTCTGSIEGLTRRCTLGATHYTQIWCSAPPPGASGMFSCRASGIATSGTSLVFCAGVLLFRRRR